jgi:hypothetical protein
LLLPPPTIGIGCVSDEPVSDVEMAAGVVTDSSLVGNCVVPFAFTDGCEEEETTALSVVGNNGGALADGAGELAACAAGVSEFSGSAGGLELLVSVAGC